LVVGTFLSGSLEYIFLCMRASFLAQAVHTSMLTDCV